MHIQFVSQPEARSSVSDYGAQKAAAQPLVAAGQAHAGEKAVQQNAFVSIHSHICLVSQRSFSRADFKRTKRQHRRDSYLRGKFNEFEFIVQPWF